MNTLFQLAQAVANVAFVLLVLALAAAINSLGEGLGWWGGEE